MDLQKDDDLTPNQFSEQADDDYDSSSQPQPSRSGITSSFVIGNAPRSRIIHRLSHPRTPFVSSDTVQPIRPSRTNNWRMNLRSNPRTDRNVIRTNVGIVEISTNTDNNNSINNRTNNGELSRNRQEMRNSFIEGGEEEEEEQQQQVENENQDNRVPRRLNYLRRRNNINNDNFSTANVELHVSSADIWEALVAIRDSRTRQERDFFTTTTDTRHWPRRPGDGVNVNIPSRGSHTVVILGDRGRAHSQNRTGQQTTYVIPRNHKIHQNSSRLTHFIEEPNVGSGYIKELCFSADGRLICSPFGHGIRLLAFSNECQELSNCVTGNNEPIQLHELAMKISHSDIVLSTKFSPRHCLLVSGCLSGKIVWYQPVV